MKKILVITLCLTMFLCNFVHADNNEPISNNDVKSIASNMIWAMKLDDQSFNNKVNNAKVISISKPINPYAVVDGSLKSLNDIKYYFIYTEKEVLAVLTYLYGENGDDTVLLGTEFVDELNDFIMKNGKVNLALIHNKGSLYFKNKNELTFATSKITNLGKNSIPNSFSLNQNSNNIKYSNIEKIDTLLLNDSEISSSMYKKLNLPYKSQYNTNLCWAAATASLGQYKTGISKTAKQIADHCEISYSAGGSYTDCQKALKDIYNISTWAGSFSLTYSDIDDDIDNDKPIIAMFYPSSGLGHGVNICGYAKSPSQGVIYYLRDSNTTSTTLAYPCKLDGQSTLKLNYYQDMAYYWKATCCYPQQ